MKSDSYAKTGDIVDINKRMESLASMSTLLEY